MRILFILTIIVFACVCLPYAVLTVWYEGLVVEEVVRIMPVYADPAYGWYMGESFRNQDLPPFPVDKKGVLAGYFAPEQEEAARPAAASYHATTVGIAWTGYLGPHMEISGFPVGGNPVVGCLYADPNYSHHRGLDFPMVTGTPILATLGGKVVFSGWNGGYGNLVVIENGLYHVYYAHMNTTPPVQVGDIVEPGQQIGVVGTTGNSTGPHLHYEIRRAEVNGPNVSAYTVDPIAFIPQTYTKWSC